MNKQAKMLLTLTFIFLISWGGNAFAVAAQKITLPVIIQKPRSIPIIRAPEINLQQGACAIVLIMGFLSLLSDRLRNGTA